MEEAVLLARVNGGAACNLMISSSAMWFCMSSAGASERQIVRAMVALIQSVSA